MTSNLMQGDGSSFFVGGGEMGALMRAHDWAATPLGAAETWPQSLRSAVSICLNSRYPIGIYWGPALALLYNDAWSPILGAKHPWALGRPAREVWPEIWDAIGPLYERVFSTGEGVWQEDELLLMNRHGYTEECYFNFTFSPVRGEGGGVEGVFNAVVETTFRVIGERRTRILREFAERTSGAKSVDEACAMAIETLRSASADVPFALLYLHSEDSGEPRLTGSAGLDPASPANSPHGWPLAHVAETGRPAMVEDLPSRFGALPGGVWPEPAHSAVVLPVMQPGRARHSGTLVAGISPRRAWDESYRGFVEQIAGYIGHAISNARAYEDERRRAEELAALDRSKTIFFSNISHEFRTPLTLMLGPLEDALAEELPAETRERLAVVQRNALRLQKLVNSLLDFSRIEAGRMQASFEPTDLAAYTADLASTFRSAAERAGLRFTVDAPPLDAPVYVDRDLWEKIVLNLVSNAYKFTLEGEIEVRLRAAGERVELTVRDTGSGIPEAELPHIFERFHRVEGTRGRTHEGTGIGLALVQELVRLHGGAIDVASREGEGTTFTVSLPTGTAHLRPEQIGARRTLASTALHADAYIDEGMPFASHTETVTAQPTGARVVLADDNADMREYLRRLLATRYDVTAVPNGRVALERIRVERPDLVLTDVMMPEMDGFALLAAIRGDPALEQIPVIMLSARAGEEARIEGVAAGADDYLVKPFSAREVLARVAGQLDLTRLRREAQRRIAESEQRLRGIVNQAVAGIAQTDLTGRFVFVNDRFCALAGRSREELLQLRMQDITDADDLPHNAELFARTARDGTPFELEKRYVRPDGTRIWVSNSVSRLVGPDGEPSGILGVSVDITDRKRIEEALRQREDFLAGILGSITDSLATFDRDWIVTFANDEAQLLGVRVGAMLWDLFPDAPGMDSYIEMHRAMEERVSTHYEVYYPRMQRWFAGKVYPTADGGVALYSQDVSERKRAEEALRATAAALREADRMKDEFLATLSHELRTPLTAIVGWTHMLTHGSLSAAEVPAALQAISDSAKAQAQLIEDVLDVSRIITGKMSLQRRATDLGSIVNAAVAAVRPAAEARRIALTVSLDPTLPPHYVDATRMQQVVWNLLSNAIKFSRPGSPVDVSLRADASSAVLEVTDHGLGIAPDFLPHLFERFRQADSSSSRAQSGLGLGLALVKELVELHGGTVRVDSELGRGSRFTVWLPAPVTLQEVDASPAATQSAGAPLEGVRVLYVDDREDARLLVTAMLRTAGAHVITAASVDEALARLGEHPPHIVLTDIAMPGRDGYALLASVRANPTWSRLPVVTLTAQGRAEDEQRAATAGFAAYLRKPIDAAALAEALARVVGGDGA